MIRWLHLSDIHESHDADFHRTAMYDEIVEAVEAREHKPDLAFLTGDLAFKGSQDEYDLFQKRFFEGLKKALPQDCPIFMVPGNHDVDRKASTKPRLWIEDEEERNLFQEVSEAGARKRRDMLLPRFKAYHAFEKAHSAWDSGWLDSNEGAICQEVTIKGRKLAIVGLNTAWLCQDNDDWGKLTAVEDLVDAALRQARALKPDRIVVLGHHPLDAMTGERPWSDGAAIRAALEGSECSLPARSFAYFGESADRRFVAVDLGHSGTGRFSGSEGPGEAEWYSLGRA